MPRRTGVPVPGSRAVGHEGVVGLLELETADELAGQEVGITGLEHGYLAKHLTRDDLDVLVVDVDTLAAVDVLDLRDDVEQHVARALEVQQVVRVDRTLGELLSERTVTPSATPGRRRARRETGRLSRDPLRR
jgi:hypothetical protein